MIRFSCPSCKTALRVASERAGTTLPCPKCKASVEVPLASDGTETEKAAAPQQGTAATVPHPTSPLEIPPPSPTVEAEPAERRDDPLEESDNSGRKPTTGWAALPTAAKAGIIGGGVGMVLLCLCSGLIGMLGGSKVKDSQTKDPSSNTAGESPKSKTGAGKSDAAAEYERGVEQGRTNAAGIISNYKQLTSGEKKGMESSIRNQIKKHDADYREMAESLGEAHPTTQYWKGLADGYRKAWRDAGFR